MNKFSAEDIKSNLFSEPNMRYHTVSWDRNNGRILRRRTSKDLNKAMEDIEEVLKLGKIRDTSAHVGCAVFKVSASKWVSGIYDPEIPKHAKTIFSA